MIHFLSKDVILDGCILVVISWLRVRHPADKSFLSDDFSTVIPLMSQRKGLHTRKESVRASVRKLENTCKFTRGRYTDPSCENNVHIMQTDKLGSTQANTRTDKRRRKQTHKHMLEMIIIK